MKPKPVPELAPPSMADMRRILEWARQRGAEQINEAERDLAIHLTLVDGSTREQQVPLVAHKLKRTRGERIEELRDWIDVYRATYAEVCRMQEHFDTIKMEYDARQIVRSVLGENQ